MLKVEIEFRIKIEKVLSMEKKQYNTDSELVMSTL